MSDFVPIPEKSIPELNIFISTLKTTVTYDFHLIADKAFWQLEFSRQMIQFKHVDIKVRNFSF